MKRELIDSLMAKILEMNKTSHGNKFDTITRGENFVLGLIHNFGAQSQASLSKKMCVSDARLAKIIKSLESKGYIIREASKTDRRVSYISFSKEGELYFDTCINDLKNEIDNLFIDVTDEEFRVVLNVIDKIINNKKKGIKND